MSWRLLKGCAIMLWMMSGCMFLLSVMAGLNSMSYLVPVLLAAGTSIAGYLFWGMANERRALMRGVEEAAEEIGLPPNLAKGLATGKLTEEEFKQLCAWTVSQEDQ